MTAGLPGTGIGGIFYLLCALLMPFYECGLIAAGKRPKRRWRFVARQAGCACTILISIWLTGLLLGTLIKSVVKGAAIHSGVRAANIIKAEAFPIMLLSLLAVICVVQLIAVLMSLKKAVSKKL